MISELKANSATQADKFNFHYCGVDSRIRTFPASKGDICKNSLVQMDFNPVNELRTLVTKVNRLKRTVTSLARTNVDLQQSLEISRRQIVEFRNLEAKQYIDRETLKDKTIGDDIECHDSDNTLGQGVASYGECHDVISTLSDQNSKMQEILESLVSGRNTETWRNISRIKDKARSLLDEIKRSKAKAKPTPEFDDERESNS